MESISLKDLTCEEIQTAEDIQFLENSAKRSSGALNISGTKTRRVMRRSLRGQLLETKALRAQEYMVMPQVRMNSDVMPPANKRMQSEDTSPKKKICPSSTKINNIEQSKYH